jgi:hypothetical protein
MADVWWRHDVQAAARSPFMSAHQGFYCATLWMTVVAARAPLSSGCYVFPSGATCWALPWSPSEMCDESITHGAWEVPYLCTISITLRSWARLPPGNFCVGSGLAAKASRPVREQALASASIHCRANLRLPQLHVLCECFIFLPMFVDHGPACP